MKKLLEGVVDTKSPSKAPRESQAWYGTSSYETDKMRRQQAPRQTDQPKTKRQERPPRARPKKKYWSQLKLGSEIVINNSRALLIV
jgi:hypothetical protein